MERTPTLDRVGRMQRRAADVITYGRTVLGFAMASAVVGTAAYAEYIPDNIEMGTVGAATAVGLLGLADKADGILARKAEKRGVEITEADIKKDPLQDKIFFYTMLGSVGVALALQDYPTSALVVGACGLATYYRDRNMTQLRNTAEKSKDITPSRLNKLKTGLQNLVHTLAVSPAVEYVSGRMLIGIGYAISVAMAYAGYFKAKRYFLKN